MSPAAPTPPATRRVRCPGCGGEAVYGPDNPWRPFCSERCRNLDLGAWASERYRVGGSAPEGDAPDLPDDER